MSVCFGAEGISSSGPALKSSTSWSRTSLWTRMASLQATIGCAYYSTFTPRLLYVYAPILHVRAPVTLLAVKSADTSSKDHRLRT
jgi:hypothetical protein